MTTTSKTTSLQAYNLVLHRGALHPEFFPIAGRTEIRHGEYAFETWIFRGGHVARFEFGGLCITETVIDEAAGLPDRGHVITLPCAGERDYDQEFNDAVVYMTSMQTETLSGHLYMSTYQEMIEHARQERCLQVSWTDENEPASLSVIDVQRHASEVHLQAYHLRGDCGLVLRTQSIFQIKDDA